MAMYPDPSLSDGPKEGGLISPVTSYIDRLQRRIEEEKALGAKWEERWTECIREIKSLEKKNEALVKENTDLWRKMGDKFKGSPDLAETLDDALNELLSDLEAAGLLIAHLRRSRLKKVVE